MVGQHEIWVGPCELGVRSETQRFDRSLSLPLPLNPTKKQRTKWALYIAIPVWFGYGLARNEEWLEIVKEKVRFRRRRRLAAQREQRARRAQREHTPNKQSSPNPPNNKRQNKQFPTKAADARGDHGRTLPTLEEEYKRVRLERLIDEELDRLATERGASNKSGKK